MNDYIGFYNGKQYKIKANTTFEAQQKISEENNIKKRYLISIILIGKNGKQVIQSTIL